MSTPETAVITLNGESLKQLNDKLAGLKERADQLQVNNAEGCLLAKQLKLDIGAYTKAVIYETGPNIEIAKEKLRNLQAQQKMLLAPAEAMLETSERKRREWENEERRLAQVEQNRINEQNRIAAQKKADEERAERERIAAAERKEAEIQAARNKRIREQEIEDQRKAGEVSKREADKLRKEAETKAAADRKAAAEAEAKERERAAEEAKKTAENVPQVTVKPSIPTMQGTVSRQNWKFRIVDETKLPRIYLCANEVAIGQTVRTVKDKARAEALIPGIEVFSE